MGSVTYFNLGCPHLYVSRASSKSHVSWHQNQRCESLWTHLGRHYKKLVIDENKYSDWWNKLACWLAVPVSEQHISKFHSLSEIERPYTRAPSAVRVWELHSLHTWLLSCASPCQQTLKNLYGKPQTGASAPPTNGACDRTLRHFHNKVCGWGEKKKIVWVSGRQNEKIEEGGECHETA